MINELSRLQYGKIGRFSSWDTSGRNADAWRIEPGETKVLATTVTGAIQKNVYRVLDDRLRRITLRFMQQYCGNCSVA